MRSNVKIVALALILTALIVGIGYAAITTVNLTVTGTAAATANQSNFKVEFFGTPTATDSSKAVVGINGEDKTKATIAVSGLTAKGDTVTATYTVKNLSADLSAGLVASVTENSNDEYFEVTTAVVDSSIAAGDTTTMTVTVKLIKTPITEDVSSNIVVTLNATPVQPAA